MILAFSAFVFVHELGHFLLAKWHGVRVLVFSIGMGPYVVSFRGKETTYVLSLIPLGGYVKMLGQEDLNPEPPKNSNPGDYRTKPVGARAAIIAAGAIFNLVFAFGIFTWCNSVGHEVDAARVGYFFTPDSPLADSPLQPGDRIMAVNGKYVKSLNEAQMLIAVDDDGAVDIDYISQSTNKREFKTLKAKTDNEFGIGTIGLNPFFEEVAYPTGFSAGVYVGELDALPPAPEDFPDPARFAAALVRAGAEQTESPAKRCWELLSERDQGFVKKVVAISATGSDADDRAVAVDHMVLAIAQVLQHPKFYRGKKDPCFQNVAMDAEAEALRTRHHEKNLAPNELSKLHRKLFKAAFAEDFIPRPSPAVEADLHAGDLVESINGRAVFHTNQLLDAVWNAGRKDLELELGIVRHANGGGRESATKTVRPSLRRFSDGQRRFLLGFGVAVRVTHIDARCEAYAAGLREGHYIHGANLAPRDSVPPGGLPLLSVAWSESGLPQEEAVVIKKIPQQTACDSALVWRTVRPAKEILRSPTFAAALYDGWRDTVSNAHLVWDVLRGLVAQRVSHKSLSGPIGIGEYLMKSSERAFPDFMWFVAFISVNLGVIQFAPIPLLDGWHLVLLAAEKLRGRPVSARVQIVFQYAGLMIVGLLIIVATRNDLLRRFF
jgi:membrane-associated protease RseP (regulator of RpoE activity)